MNIKILATAGAIVALTTGPAIAAPVNPQPASPGVTGPVSPAPAGNNTNPGAPGSNDTPDMNSMMPSSGANTTPSGTLAPTTTPCNFTGSVPGAAGSVGNTGTTGGTTTGTMGMNNNTTGVPGVSGPPAGTNPCE